MSWCAVQCLYPTVTACYRCAYICSGPWKLCLLAERYRHVGRRSCTVHDPVGPSSSGILGPHCSVSHLPVAIEPSQLCASFKLFHMAAYKPHFHTHRRSANIAIGCSHTKENILQLADFLLRCPSAAHGSHRGKIPTGDLLDYIKADICNTLKGGKSHLCGLELFSLALTLVLLDSG